MHHFGEDSVKVKLMGNKFHIVITNKVSGAKIDITGPLTGLLENTKRVMDENTVQNIGREISHLLRSKLL